ncbi:hypothetical protein M885DRAFT_521808 [Pelagophyceae sp. CCMP2097]|nr:hypothetical protein M885DRAFT_521808 [Pelagophyceae sp. CCMP2097]
MDATMMRMEDLVQELERRHLHPKGFFVDDAKELQKHLDAEHESELEKLKEERRAQRQRSKQKAQLQRKRLQLEKQLREEYDAVANDHKVESWLAVVRADETRPAARIAVCSITARALAKALWDNMSLTSLDLSRNGLSDFAGAQLGRMLKRNCGLRQLELNENHLGPRTCRALGDSLRTNATLQALHLESNPLLQPAPAASARLPQHDGLAQLASALAVNTSLTLLSLWRCDLGMQSGNDLATALKQNASMTNLDVGNNAISVVDKRAIMEKLEQNKKETRSAQVKHAAVRAQLDADEGAKRAVDAEETKQRDLEAWMDAQRDERAARRIADATAVLQQRKEEEAKKADAEREEREAKKLAELAAKNKKGKKGKKGKK